MLRVSSTATPSHDLKQNLEHVRLGIFIAGTLHLAHLVATARVEWRSGAGDSDQALVIANNS